MQTKNKSKQPGKEVKYERTYVMSCQLSILVIVGKAILS